MTSELEVSSQVRNVNFPFEGTRTASSRGRYGERRQRDPCLKHTYKNTTCWPATAYDVTTPGANHSIKGRRENTSSSSLSSMTVLFEACILLVRTNFYCYYGEH